ncbi:MAG: hypothetical protein IT385_07920 [Deltaproteobacteria bacterium]|nr:hypothetical protein [Deltaproteobacteria bacterium]
MGLDVARVLALHATTPPAAALAAELQALSLALQFARTALAMLLVPLGWRLAAPADRRLVAALFLGLLVADWLIILERELVAGVMLFLVLQLGWIARHARGLRAAWRDPPRRRTLVLLFLGVLVAWAGSVPVLAGPLEAAGLLAPLGAYSVVLLASVFVALTTPLTGALPPRAARMVVIGMIAFAACDMTVALGAAHRGTLVGDLADLATGLFWAPAIVLLALSMRRPERQAA